MKTIKPHSAIALFSGGLDSIIVVKMMQGLGYEIFPVFFSTPYLPPHKALEYAKLNGINLLVRDISEAHLQMIKSPRYGFGKNHNPCIDCHALMFQLAGEMLQELGASFIISGEVVGQRPMSQRRDALNSVSKTSGVGDLIIRPLSQKLLADTLPIREGWINKDEMLDLQGRGRNAQMELATKLGIIDYPSPGGGCLLTDAGYSLRLRELIQHGQDNPHTIGLLRWGRHFRLSPQIKLIVGRSEADNNGLSQAATDETRLSIKDMRGPLGILSGGNPDEPILRIAASIVLSYSRKAPATAAVRYQPKDGMEQILMVSKIPLENLNQYKINIE
ncbi:MAG: tRNA (5-methylaminomethyl-2-thiouridylate)-methyltransferase [Candidatus Cloacimonetes bacterium]|nr:tRNA (5-methylaminomethyl-2-thiouridylate)-methyltransferase [Candidatus Cloacimonadota bacterium]